MSRSHALVVSAFAALALVAVVLTSQSASSAHVASSPRTATPFTPAPAPDRILPTQTPASAATPIPPAPSVPPQPIPANVAAVGASHQAPRASAPYHKPLDAYTPPQLSPAQVEAATTGLPAARTPSATSTPAASPLDSSPCTGSVTLTSDLNPLYDYLTVLLEGRDVSGCSTPYFEFWANYNGADHVISCYQGNSQFLWDTAGLPGGPNGSPATYQLFVYVYHTMPTDPCATNVYDTYSSRYSLAFTRHCDLTGVDFPRDSCGGDWSTVRNLIGEQRGMTYDQPTNNFDYAYADIGYQNGNQPSFQSPFSAYCNSNDAIYEYVAMNVNGQADTSFSQSGFAYTQGYNGEGQCVNVPEVFAVVLTSAQVNCPLGGSYIYDNTHQPPIQPTSPYVAQATPGFITYKGCFVPVTNTTLFSQGLSNGQIAFFEHSTYNNTLYIDTGYSGTPGIGILTEYLPNGNGMYYAGISTEINERSSIGTTLADYVSQGLYVDATYTFVEAIPIGQSTWQVLTIPPAGPYTRVSTELPIAGGGTVSGPDIYCDRPFGADYIGSNQNGTPVSYRMLSGWRGTSCS